MEEKLKNENPEISFADQILIRLVWIDVILLFMELILLQRAICSQPQKKVIMKAYHEFQKCIEACLKCAAICNHCASSCTQEDDVAMMARCIQLDMECAAICNAAAQVMSMGSEYASDLCRICADICEDCGNECGQHDTEHCRECAEACLECAKICRQMAA
jgi:hypothetical protein